MKIIDLKSLQVLDSRGNPTLQVDIMLEDGSVGSFQVPSGASKGRSEALEIRDGNMNAFFGMGVLRVINIVEEIKHELIGVEFTQEELDRKLLKIDGTENKSVLGANTVLGISIAFAKASAKFYNLSLCEYLYRLINGKSFKSKSEMRLSNTTLFSNVINGGLHSGNSLNIQEFMIVPNFDSFENNVKAVCEVYHTLKGLIDEGYGRSQSSVGDEGGFAPDISKPDEALDLLVEAIHKSNYKDYIFIALDVAASDLYDSASKKYEIESGLFLSYKELTKYYEDLIDKYPIISIEDPFDEEDTKGFSYFMKIVKKKNLGFVNPISNKAELMVVGDDLLVTNTERIKEALRMKLCNSLLLKINQIGTLTESMEAFRLAKSRKWQVIVSHRSGETTDAFISDLAVAMECPIKLGAPARGERVAKYNRLFEIYRWKS